MTMAKTFGLVSLLAALAVAGWLFMAQAKEVGPTSERGQQAQADAAAGVAGTNFRAAAMQLEAYRAQAGSYAGATLPPTFGVVLARADASSYCLQAGSGAAVQHHAGPGGSSAPGPC